MLNSLKDDSINSYLNPNDGILNIELKGETYNSLEIFSSNGILVFSKELLAENAIKLDIKSFVQTAFYIASLKSNNKTSTKKLIVN